MAAPEHSQLLELEAAVAADVDQYARCPLADKARTAKLSAAIQHKLARHRALTRDLELLVEEMDSDDEEQQPAAQLLAGHKAEYERLQGALRAAALAQRTAALQAAADERRELLAGGEAGLRQRRAQREADSVALAEDVTGGLRRTRQVLAEELEHTSATLAAMEQSHTQLGKTRDEYHGQHRHLRRSRGLLGTLSWQTKSVRLETYMLWMGLTLFLAVCAYVFAKRAGHFVPDSLKPAALLGGGRAPPATRQPLSAPSPVRRPSHLPPLTPGGGGKGGRRPPAPPLEEQPPLEQPLLEEPAALQQELPLEQQWGQPGEGQMAEQQPPAEPVDQASPSPQQARQQRQQPQQPKRQQPPGKQQQPGKQPDKQPAKQQEPEQLEQEHPPEQQAAAEQSEEEEQPPPQQEQQQEQQRRQPEELEPLEAPAEPEAQQAEERAVPKPAAAEERAQQPEAQEPSGTGQQAAAEEPAAAVVEPGQQPGAEAEGAPRGGADQPAQEEPQPAVAPQGGPEPDAGADEAELVMTGGSLQYIDRQGRRIAVDGPDFVRVPVQAAPPADEEGQEAAAVEGVEPAEAAAEHLAGVAAEEAVGGTGDEAEAGPRDEL